MFSLVRRYKWNLPISAVYGCRNKVCWRFYSELWLARKNQCIFTKIDSQFIGFCNSISFWLLMIDFFQHTKYNNIFTHLINTIHRLQWNPISAGPIPSCYEQRWPWHKDVMWIYVYGPYSTFWWLREEIFILNTLAEREITRSSYNEDKSVIYRRRRLYSFLSSTITSTVVSISSNIRYTFFAMGLNVKMNKWIKRSKENKQTIISKTSKTTGFVVLSPFAVIHTPYGRFSVVFGFSYIPFTVLKSAFCVHISIQQFCLFCHI